MIKKFSIKRVLQGRLFMGEEIVSSIILHTFILFFQKRIFHVLADIFMKRKFLLLNLRS